MKKDHRKEDDYELFYLELPITDYYGDIEIQDEYESTDSDKRGLSAEQVSQIARDSLEAAAKEQPKPEPDTNNQD